MRGTRPTHVISSYGQTRIAWDCLSTNNGEGCVSDFHANKSASLNRAILCMNAPLQDEHRGLATRLKALPKPAPDDICIKKLLGQAPEHGISELISTSKSAQADKEPL